MITQVTTAVVSDLHLGARTKRPIAAEPAARAALLERLARVDRVVLLGDVLELREAPQAEVLKVAEPFFRDLAAALEGRPVAIVPGNHDHQLAAPLLDARRLDADRPPLAVDESMPAPPWGPLGRIADWLGPSDLELAYPGTWIREDVFATHGHYLDAHNTVPSLERLAVAVTERAIGGLPPGPRTPDDYEAALGPVYSLSFSLAQATGSRGSAGGGASLRIWQTAGGANGRRSLAGRALSDVVIPGAVAALNRAGLGPFRSDLSGQELRRAALAGTVEALARLGVAPAYAIFGHTHRSGPWPEDDAAEWTLPGGGALINSGSWIWEPAFVGDRGSRSPYWPGNVVLVDDDGPPRLERVLESVALSPECGDLNRL